MQSHFRNLPDGIVFVDMQGQTLEFSPSTMAMFGYASVEEQAGRPVTDFLVPEDRPRAAASFSRRLRGEDPGLNEYRGLRADGTTFPVEVNGRTLVGPEGQPKEVLFIIRDISGRRQMEQKLEQTSQLLQAAFRVAGMGHIITNLQDPAWPWESSPGVDELLGIDLDFVKNREGWAALLHPEDRDAVLSQISESVENHRTFAKQFRIHRPADGELRWIAVWADTHHDPDGQPLRQVGILQDITTAKQAELAVAENEERFRLAMEITSDGLWDLNLATGGCYLSPAYARLLGFEPDEFERLAKNWADFVHPHDQARLLALNQACIQGTREGFEAEYRFIARDGSCKWVLGRGKVIRRDASGRALRMIGTNIDITAGKRAEDSLLASQFQAQELSARLNSILESPKGVVIFALDTNYCYTTFTAEHKAVMKTIWGVDICLGTSMLNAILDPKDREKAKRNFDRVFAGEDLVLVEEYGNPPNRIVYENRYSPIVDEKGALRGLTVFVIDITERKQFLDEKARLEEQLLQSQKMESLGLLAGGIAHDMNNVLGAILGLAELHRSQSSPGTSLSRDLGIVVNATRRGSRMVRSLLNFARQSPAEEQALDLNAIIREQANLLERTTLARVDLTLDLAPDLRPIVGDPTALTNALMNLCVNAVDAMEGGGSLLFRTRNVDEDWVEVLVEDTGIGMPEEVLARAMDPFFTTKETGKGTGLGLSMVYTIVKAHKGQIDLSSQPGTGTRVRVRFPSIEPTPQPTKSPAPEVTPQLYGLTVFVVDDDEMIRCAMEVMLEALGHRPHLFPSGESVLEALAGPAETDMVILDMNMPGMGGGGTLPLLRDLRPTLPVLLATGRADQAAVNLADAHPLVTLISKPFGLGELQKYLDAHKRA